MLNKDEFSIQLSVIVGGWSIPFQTFLKHEVIIQLYHNFLLHCTVAQNFVPSLGSSFTV